MPPAEKWNNRYFGVGNPAFEGAIKYQGLKGAVEKGYATALTDTGHEDPGHKWAMGQPERLVDWTQRAVHETTVVAKELIKAYYGKPQKYAYWDSCHNGGRQGLTEAQLYPAGFRWHCRGRSSLLSDASAVGLGIFKLVKSEERHCRCLLHPAGKISRIASRRSGSLRRQRRRQRRAIEDPTRCKFDPIAIQCKDEDNASCLTPAQVETARRIYAGAKFADGTQIYSGFEPGSELVWEAMIKGPEPLFINNDYFKYIAFENPNWDFRTFDVDADTRTIDKRIGPIINHTQTDLKAFKEHGGKLVMYQDWNETWVPPRTATTYYDGVVKTMGGDNKTKDFFRLFMIPDYGMCAAMFPGTFDAVGAVQKWVEEGVAPDQIKATYAEQSRQFRERAGMEDTLQSKIRVIKTRPVCPYPQVAIYNGSGDTNDASKFQVRHADLEVSD